MENQPSRSFAQYSRAGFTESLLPCAPPGARLSPLSKIGPKSLGKIPCRLTSDGWVGLTNWTKHVTSLTDIERWDQWLRLPEGCNISLRCDRFPCLDIDVNDDELSERLLNVICGIGNGPVRRVQAPDGIVGSRFLMLFSGEPLASWTTSFRYNDADHMIELKGADRQCLIEGQHHSGGAYCWIGSNPIDLGVAGLCSLTSGQAADIRRRLESEIVAAGGTLSARGQSGMPGSGRSGRVGVAAPDLPAVRAALAAYPNNDDVGREEWVNVAHYTKGASQAFESEGLEAFLDWSEGYEGNTPDEVIALWNSIRLPVQSGWDQLADWAQSRSSGGFSAAAYDFNAVEGETEPGPDSIDALFKRHIWVERQEGIFDLESRRLRGKTAFDAHAAYLGPVWTRQKTTPWTYFLREPDRVTATSAKARRKTVVDRTYRPGMPHFWEDGDDTYVNDWRAPEGIPTGPVADADIQLWLNHLAIIVPKDDERRCLLGWMASVAQQQAAKPNHGVVLGGAHGIGKSSLFLPLKAAVGKTDATDLNVRDLDDNFSDWLGSTKVFFVEEMMNFGKKAMMQRLKNLLAAPPDTLQVNPKYGKRYQVPNILAGVFFTNHEDAVAVEKGERRFLILWSPAKKQPASYYATYVNWLRGGGDLKVARWLLDYEASHYDMFGNAPQTSALEDMRKASRSKLDEWVEDGIEYETGAFAPDLVALDDMRASIPEDAVGRFGKPSYGAFASALKRAGATPVGKRPALGLPPAGVSTPHCDPKQARLFALRRHDMYADLTNSKLVELYWLQRRKAEQADPWPSPATDAMEMFK